MAARHVEPTLGGASFSCPHCGTLAHQTWFRMYARACDKDSQPSMFSPEGIARIENDPNLSKEGRLTLKQWAERINSREIFLEDSNTNVYAPHANNVYLSRCYSCDQYALWRGDVLIYPEAGFEVAPNDDLAPEIKDDFNEAATILDLSPRGAAALLRSLYKSS